VGAEVRDGAVEIDLGAGERPHPGPDRTAAWLHLTLMTTFTGPPIESELGTGALTFGSFLDEIAMRYRDREAVVLNVAGRERVSWTYADVREQARRTAKALVAVGVSRGTRVGVLTSGRPEWVAAVFGAALAGGVAVPFNTFAEPRELDHLLRHSDVAVVLTQSAFLKHRYAEQILELCDLSPDAQPRSILTKKYPFLRRVVALDATEDAPAAVRRWEDFLADGDTVPDDVIDAIVRETTPSDDGIIIYSSGTTSLPKGVLHMHRAPMLQGWRHGYREQFTPDDRVYSETPLFWTAGVAAVMAATLSRGACLVLHPLFDADDALRLIEEERVTILQMMPHRDVDLQASYAGNRRDISTVRRDRYRITGEPPLAKRNASQSAYGSSETFTSATALPHDASVEDLDTYGALIAGSSIRIVDAASGEALGPDEEGEITLKGLTLMRGYVKVPPESTFDAEGYFHTGDAGWIDDRGLLHWTGRLTTMIKTSGANVSPLEVEEVLGEHPQVKGVAVVGVPDPVAGEIVVACVVPTEGSALSEDDVRQFLRGSLSTFKIPRRVLFFDESDLPKTGTEKFNVNAARAIAADALAAQERAH
jgi:fatty-acyl-CoA synthase